MKKKNKEPDIIENGQDTTGEASEAQQQQQNQQAAREETTAELQNKKYKYILTKKEAKKHEKRRKVVIILLIFLLITLLFGGTVYAMLSFIEYNSFKVLIDREGSNILSLSNSGDFAYPSEVLSLGGPKYMDNITLMDIYHRIPEFEAVDGSFTKGEEHAKYLAATFYLKNVSEETQIFTEAILLSDITKGVDDAIRIMVIRDGDRQIYAKSAADGNPEEVVPGRYFTTDGVSNSKGDVWMATPFSSPVHAFYNSGLILKPGEVKKYTLLVWLEGWDPECVDDRLGGTIKVEFYFSQEKQ